MGLDVYVGSLTRYYAGDWETIMQRTAREQGMKFKVIRTIPDPADKITDPVVINEALNLWRDSLGRSLEEHLSEGLTWDERADAPYFTDKPAWDGYAGLILLAAHREHPHLPSIKRVDRKWDEDAAFRASTAPDFKSRFLQLFNVELWLPCEFPFTFQAEDAAGNAVWFGSSVALVNQLNMLNAESYCGSEEDLAKWLFDGASATYEFEQSSKFGLALFLKHAELSVRHRLPMKLDY